MQYNEQQVRYNNVDLVMGHKSPRPLQDRGAIGHFEKIQYLGTKIFGLANTELKTGLYIFKKIMGKKWGLTPRLTNGIYATKDIDRYIQVMLNRESSPEVLEAEKYKFCTLFQYYIVYSFSNASSYCCTKILTLN